MEVQAAPRAEDRRARSLIDIDALTKVYQMGSQEVHALAGVTLDIEQNEYVAIMGPSGSGKSTLMNMLGCLDTPTGGTYFLNGENVSEMTDDELAAIRNREIGFVFQTFNLLPRVSCVQNAELPLIYAGITRRERRERAAEALRDVGLGDRLDHKPASFPAGSASAWPWRAPSSRAPPSFWPTSQQATSTRRRARTSCAFSKRSTVRATRSSWSRTRRTSPGTPAASSACATARSSATSRWSAPPSPAPTSTRSR